MTRKKGENDTIFPCHPVGLRMSIYIKKVTHKVELQYILEYLITSRKIEIPNNISRSKLNEKNARK